MMQEFFLQGETNNNCVLTTQFETPFQLFHSQGFPLTPKPNPQPSRKEKMEVPK
jgi:hypothetical protein